MINPISRRQLVKFGVAGAALAAHRGAWATPAAPDAAPAALIARARAALARHADRIVHLDRFGVVDFSQRSGAPRLFLVEADGRTASHLVAHGRGSDPTHTGILERFSNEAGSYASSAGAYLTGQPYVGGHGRSMRLAGLDPTNSNAEARAIVVHAALYVAPAMARATGMIGRSEGCFAVASTSLDEVLEKLGPGRLLYADKV